ncbi:MAG TPA: DUF2971 domain-containing protein [Balneolales bacterium]|nr:DUF2971 domain-containing protein [Balneolales bacterium]
MELYKYIANNKDIIKGLFYNNKIRFTQPWALNDPLEFNPIITTNNVDDIYSHYDFDGVDLYSLVQFYRLGMIEPFINKFGILSLTENSESFDMWNIYANGHKGFCLGFKDNFMQHPYLINKNNHSYKLEKVNYVDDFSININELGDENTPIDKEALFQKLFFNKSSRWCHENESRIVRPLSDSNDYIGPISEHVHRDERLYLFEFSLDWIDSIAFGAHMSYENKKCILDACEQSEIIFFQAYIIRNIEDENGRMGKVEYFKIGKANGKNANEIIPTWEPYHFCQDKEEWKLRTNKKRIKSLSELPYFKGNESKVMSQYYKAKNHF